MLVLGTAHPEALPELFSYQLLIVQHSTARSSITPLGYAMTLTSVRGRDKPEQRLGHKSTPSATLSRLPAKGPPHSGAQSASSMVVTTPSIARAFPLLPSCPHRKAVRASYAPPLRRPLMPPTSQPPPPKHPQFSHCILYNKQDGNCPYGRDCKFAHSCSHCKKAGHPISRCPDEFAQ